jgi:hypothetical protein
MACGKRLSDPKGITPNLFISRSEIRESGVATGTLELLI